MYLIIIFLHKQVNLVFFLLSVIPRDLHSTHLLHLFNLFKNTKATLRQKKKGTNHFNYFVLILNQFCRYRELKRFLLWRWISVGNENLDSWLIVYDEVFFLLERIYYISRSICSSMVLIMIKLIRIRFRKNFDSEGKKMFCLLQYLIKGQYSI